MTVSLTFGVNGYVAVKDVNDRELYRQAVQSQKEADNWIDKYQKSVKGWDFFKSSIIPVRVDNCEDLMKDLFLPTFVNHAVKLNNLFAGF